MAFDERGRGAQEAAAAVIAAAAPSPAPRVDATALRVAARIIHQEHERRGWKWGTGKTAAAPTLAQVEARILRLVALSALHAGGLATGPHMLVSAIEGGYDVHLIAATVSLEALPPGGTR